MTDELAAPNMNNAVIDGDDITQDDTKLGQRVGNHCQTSVKQVKVSTRAQASNTIGYANALSEQVIRRQQELRRDLEAIALSNQASVADDGTVPGKAGALGSWLETNVSGGTPGGFDFATGLTTAPTVAAGHGLTEVEVRDVMESVYMEGGEADIMMSIPSVIRKFSEYLFTASARVATLMSDQGKSREKAAALGSISVFVTDHGTLQLISNRLQQTYDADDSPPMANVYLLDTTYLRMTYLRGFRTEPMAKTGLYDKRLMSVDWTLKVLTEKSQGVIFGVDPTVDVVHG